MIPRSLFHFAIILSWAALLFGPLPAWCIDINGVLPVSAELPTINYYISLSENGPPQLNPDADPELMIPYFTVTAYFDTGASGILLSYETAAALSVPKSSSGGNLVIYEDVGVGGSEQFNVSAPIYLALAGNPNADLDNIATYQTAYDQKLGPVRTQIATNPVGLFESPLDVVGVPAMTGKVVVFDPKPLDTLEDFSKTYLYNPGTPYHPATTDTNPGIPSTGSHIRLSYASFDRFTQMTPAGAAGPNMAANPFIGPNPVAKLYGDPVDNTPGVTVSLGGLKTTGSFLLDTGAQASMISLDLAAALHVRYVGDSQESNELELFDPARPGWTGTIPNQFTMEIGGIGGSVMATGFFLDSMLLHTLEGDAANDLDPNHLSFLHVPVLVNDITVQDPITQQTLTLDGIFGMNNMMLSFMADLSDISPGNFNWMVFDQPNGILGLDAKSPLTSTSAWTGGGNPADAHWSNASNWGGTAPASGVVLAFGQATPTSINNSNDFADGTLFSGISFEGNSAFNLQGNRVALAGFVLNYSTQTQTISLDLTLTGMSRAFTAATGDIVVNGHIGGDQGLVKMGANKLILKNSNTYKGSTTICEGALVLDGGDLADSSPVSVASGALLAVVNGTPSLGVVSGLGSASVSGSGTKLTVGSIRVGTLSLVKLPVSSLWTGGGNPTDSHWSNPLNWDGTAPNPTNVLIFGQSTPFSVNNANDLPADTSFTEITFKGSTAFVLQGNRIALAGNVLNSSTQTQTIGLDMTLANMTSIFMAATGDIVINGHIGGDQGLVKTGANKLILKNADTYTGDTTVSEGMLVLDGGDLADTSAVSVASEASLEILSGTPILGNISGQGSLYITGLGTTLTAQSISIGSLSIGGSAPAAVPEPSVFVLLAAVAVALTWFWRKSR